MKFGKKLAEFRIEITDCDNKAKVAIYLKGDSRLLEEAIVTSCIKSEELKRLIIGAATEYCKKKLEEEMEEIALRFGKKAEA